MKDQNDNDLVENDASTKFNVSHSVNIKAVMRELKCKCD